MTDMSPGRYSPDLPASPTLLKIVPTLNFQKRPAIGQFFFKWDSLHAKLNSHQKTWSCKKDKNKIK